MRLRTLGALLLGLALLSVSTATAQERFGSLTGLIKDSTQASVPGVAVTATNKQTGTSRATTTGADGAYRLNDLDPGRYAVTAELSGFQKATDENVLILLGRTVDFSPTLQIGAITEVVNITGATP